VNDEIQAGALSIGDLSVLREKTEAISQLLRNELEGHLRTIAPVIAPERLLGKHVRSGQRSEVPGSDRSFQELKERYAQVAPRPFGLLAELNEDPISIEGRLELYPWEYTHKLADGRAITMTSPLRWVLAYRSGYTLSQLRAALAARESRRNEDVRQFLASAIALQLAFDKHVEIGALIEGLRYEVQSATCEGMGQVPLVTLRSCIDSIRPSDDLIAAATRFSGIPAFIEIVDVAAVRRLRDPLRERIEAMLR
jgi:hypothetical protein